MIKNSAWSYYNFLIMGGFNIEPNDPFVTSFCDSNSFINLISLESFKRDLSNALGSSSDSFDEFDHIFITKLNKHALKNKKLIKGKRKPHVN